MFFEETPQTPQQEGETPSCTYPHSQLRCSVVRIAEIALGTPLVVTIPDRWGFLRGLRFPPTAQDQLNIKNISVNNKKLEIAVIIQNANFSESENMTWKECRDTLWFLT
ncbi:hypothetical protein DPMN_163909 [Dreissena polymorpha]|uniref:Uncharacterized protein n=1 Tax=Dreissena polymorpha TaxID=45954 RepID=A0A9D4ESQ0_DREPO|nr:hypothetical protein DPMN_163909 [Dreissena polymorpha]